MKCHYAVLRSGFTNGKQNKINTPSAHHPRSGKFSCARRSAISVATARISSRLRDCPNLKRGAFEADTRQRRRLECQTSARINCTNCGSALKTAANLGANFVTNGTRNKTTDRRDGRHETKKPEWKSESHRGEPLIFKSKSVRTSNRIAGT